jgi:hypothetical protein
VALATAGQGALALALSATRVGELAVGYVLLVAGLSTRRRRRPAGRPRGSRSRVEGSPV